MTGRSYIKRLSILLAAFVAWLVGFPFVTWGIGRLLHCQAGSGGCGAVALLSGVTVLPLGLLVIFVTMALVVVGRLKALGTSRLLALMMLPLLLADIGLLMGLGGHWSVGFTLGVVAHAPWRGLAAVATLVFLALHPDDVKLSGWTAPKAVALAVLLILSASVLLQFGLTAFLALTRKFGAGQLYGVLLRVGQMGPLLFALLTASYAMILIRARSTPPDGDERDGEPVDGPGGAPDWTPGPRSSGGAVTFGRRGVV